jgi:potassium-transporting ATPase KdpC subunit
VRSLIRPAAVLTALLTVATGVVYPGLVTALARLLFGPQADGMLIAPGDHPMGSALIGQPFSDPRYFWSRPSATAPVPYNGGASAASNYGPTNPALVDSEVAPRIAQLRAADAGNTAPIPVDLVTSSGSGLDPHISPAAAEYQVTRVARARGLDPARVRRLVARHTEGLQLGVLGEPRVNVLLLNLALDSLSGGARP